MFILNRILTSNIPVAIKKKMHITFLINPGLQSHKLHKYILFYHYQIKLFLPLICSPRPILGHQQADNLTHPMLVTAILSYFDLKVTWSCVTRLNPQSWMSASALFELETFHSELTHYSNLPLSSYSDVSFH